MNQQHYLLSEVARAVGRKPYQIAYMISNGELDEPKLRIGNRRVFTDEEVARIRDIVQAKDLKKKSATSARHEGQRQ
jgi:DNA-binding transcriptional MerR regulator